MYSFFCIKIVLLFHNMCKRGEDGRIAQGFRYCASIEVRLLCRGYTQFFHKLSLYCTLKLKGLVTTLATLYCKVINSAIWSFSVM